MKTTHKTDRGHQKMNSETHEIEIYLCNFDSSIKIKCQIATLTQARIERTHCVTARKFVYNN